MIGGTYSSPVSVLWLYGLQILIEVSRPAPMLAEQEVHFYPIVSELQSVRGKLYKVVGLR